MTHDDDLRALDVEIAKALGLDVHTEGGVNGMEWINSIRDWVTEWYVTGAHTLDYEAHEILYYTTDLNAALSLFATLPHDWTPRLVRMLQPRGDHMAIVWKAHIMHNETHEDFEYIHDEPAEAVAMVWLAWRRSTAGADDTAADALSS